jgi:RepB DNA-primase from phage plasmid/CHC2 zinc finger
MTTATLTRHETVTRFLAVLAGAGASGEFLELRYRLEDGIRMGQVFERRAHLRGLATRAIVLGRRTDVYVGCAPRTRRYGGRDAVTHAHVLWADCDGEDAVAALETFEPAPAIVIASGTNANCHAYWPLTAPLARDEVERGNRRLAHALGADPASADCARILRVPSTLSRKRDPPTRVDALRLDIDRRLVVDDIVGGLTDPPQPGPPAAPRPAVVDGDDPLLAIAPEVYVQRLLGVQVPRHRKVACPFHDLSVVEATADDVSPARSVDDASLNDRAAGDPLLLVPPPVYFERLTGLRVGPSGKLHCLFHDDRSPSLHVYPEPERGWYCFGCRRGGSVYDLAALLLGRGTRGRDFVELRRELEQRLL